MRPLRLPSCVVGCMLTPYDAKWVASLWREVAQAVGREHLVPLGQPHVSLIVGGSTDLPRAKAAFGPIAAATAPLLATTAGLAVFPSASPALYLPVVRSRALDALHRAMTDASVGVVHEPHPHYHPDAWVPHITVARLQATTASLDVPTRRRLARAVAALADRDHAHAVRLSTLACLHDDGTRRIVDLELTLGDRSA